MIGALCNRNGSHRLVESSEEQSTCDSPATPLYGRSQEAWVRLRPFSWLILLAACAAATGLAKDVTTYHNDLFRTGLNAQETILTTSNVKFASFGKLFAFSVDGKIDAQPLYLSAVSIPGKGTHNVVFAVTENDSVYALDADKGTPLWQVSLLPIGESPSDDHGCGQISPQIGITSTPVIDRSSGPHGIIYVVAMSRNSSNKYFHRIHALDVASGQEKLGGPVSVRAKYRNHQGFVTFDPGQYAERQGLLLLKHVVYTAWTSHCDQPPYTGWTVGYSESTLAQTGVLNVTPNGSEGAIWQSGAAMASDGSNIFFLDANGIFDTELNKRGFPMNGDYGNGFVKVTIKNTKLTITDYFNMFNTVEESNNDDDLGSGGALLLPTMKDANGKARFLAMGAGKDSNIYIVDRTNMGKFNPNTNNIYQEIDGALSGGVWSMPAYFNGSVYYGPQGNNLLQFRFWQAKLSTSPASKSANTFGYPGTTPSVSANGVRNGIVWAIEHSGPDVLHAYDATNLGNELYNTNQAPNGRDQFGNASHFGTPMIVNGKVYVGTDNSVAVFGQLGK
jgi:outer membrane protein assembly factor BamB